MELRLPLEIPRGERPLVVLLGRAAQVESSRVREPRRTVLPLVSSLQFYGGGISSWVVFGKSL